ncbi:TPA: hypothetical protein ACKOSN_000630 [Clostridioides difficile]|uniref:hypothetical protein n=1 Tax=Clostridioides difficile TaxID=1496 RepID=UPI0010BBB3EC|nr:hypothetical protein [Clostridioides difficile]UUV16471.1 hypothetical protein NQ183_09325 [Clostridioides difficile]VHY39834.1 peptide maturation system acyl carrier-related protein [Clostridioides difficile]
MNIEVILNDIFIQRAGIDFITFEELQKESLFGSKLGIPVRELILIFFDIENIFNILISENEINDNSFYTYERLLNIIYEQK